MKVLELVLKWESGGVERYVEDLVRASRAKGVDCCVASVTTEIPSQSVDGYGPLVNRGVTGALLHGGAVKAFVEKGGYDVVHIHGNNGLAFCFAHQTRKAGAKAVVHSHNSSFGDDRRGAKALFTAMQRKLYSRDCACRIACSRSAGDFLFAGEAYRVALNGIDTHRFTFDAAARAAIRDEFEISQDAPVIGFAASFIDAKNPLFALEIFRAVVGLVPETRFLVCGDGVLLESFKAAAADLISDESCICAGRVTDIERFYCAMDVLLTPSKYEGLPINLVEAQACGLPVVMSDAVTNEVVVVPEICGRVGLDKPCGVWANAVAEAFALPDGRTADYSETVKRAGYCQPECFKVVLDAYREVCR